LDLDTNRVRLDEHFVAIDVPMKAAGVIAPGFDGGGTRVQEVRVRIDTDQLRRLTEGSVAWRFASP
jgi:hypothetical protein